MGCDSLVLRKGGHTPLWNHRKRWANLLLSHQLFFSFFDSPPQVIEQSLFLFSFPRFSLLSIVGNRRCCLLLFLFSVETFAAHVYNRKRAKDKKKKSQKKYLSLFTKREGGVFLFRWEWKRKMFPGSELSFLKNNSFTSFFARTRVFCPLRRQLIIGPFDEQLKQSVGSSLAPQIMNAAVLRPRPDFFSRKRVFPPPTPNLIYNGEIVLPAVRSLDRVFFPVKPTPNQPQRKRKNQAYFSSIWAQATNPTRDLNLTHLGSPPPSDFSPPKKDTFGSKPTDTKRGGRKLILGGSSSKGEIRRGKGMGERKDAFSLFFLREKTIHLSYSL